MPGGIRYAGCLPTHWETWDPGLRKQKGEGPSSVERGEESASRCMGQLGGEWQEDSDPVGTC